MIAEDETRVAQLQDVRIEEIGFIGENHRCVVVEPGPALQSLADSIKADGLLSPILLTRAGGTSKQGVPTPYGVVYGHRRLAACRMIGWQRIPALVKASMSMAEVLAERAVENLQREDLNVIEQLTAVRQLVDAARGDLPGRIEHAAAKIGKTTRWVRDLLYLDERLCNQVKELALDDYLLLGHLRELAKVGDHARQACLAGQASGMYWTGKAWSSSPAWVPASVRDDSEGEMQRISVDALRKLVDAEQRKLDRVPWELGVPFAKRPACAGCEHNTATDGELFAGISNAETGVCMNPGCHAAKTEACNKAVLTVSAQAKTAKDAGKAYVEQIKPAFLKIGTAQRAAKKAVEPASKSAGGKAKGGSRDHGPKLSPEQKALATAVEKYSKAYEQWIKVAAKAIGDRAGDNAHARVGLCVLACHKSLDIPYANSGTSSAYGDGPQKPGPGQKVGPKLRAVLDLLSEAVATLLPRTGWDAIAEMSEGVQLGRPSPIMGWNPSEEYVVALAQAVGAEIPPAPDWADYKPAPPGKPEPKKPAKKKPAVKKRASKGKAGTKRKAAGAGSGGTSGGGGGGK